MAESLPEIVGDQMVWYTNKAIVAQGLQYGVSFLYSYVRAQRRIIGGGFWLRKTSSKATKNESREILASTRTSSDGSQNSEVSL